jgi:hypothetical protein
LDKSITTVIPTYFDSGIPLGRFESCLESIRRQTIRPEKIIITDDSKKVDFMNTLWPSLKDFDIPIEYIKNPNSRGMGSNSNFGLSNTSSQFIHILHSDDCLDDSEAYEKMLCEINICPSGWIFVGGRVNLLVNSPTLNDFLMFGINTLGGPSGLFALREKYLSYDTELKMLVDVEQYSRMITEFGPPGIINEPLIEYGVGPWQVQNNISSKEIILEYKYILEKYPEVKKKIEILEETSTDLEMQIRLKKLHLLMHDRNYKHILYWRLFFLFMRRALKKIKRVLNQLLNPGLRRV